MNCRSPTLGKKGVKAIARRFSFETWSNVICQDPACWELASMTAEEADIAIHRALNP